MNNDRNVGIKIQLSHEDSLIEGTIIRRRTTKDSVPVGEANDNPLLDTRLYEVEMATGEIEIYTANQLTEYLYDQVDDYGRSSTLFEGIVSHEKTGEAIDKHDGWISLKVRNKFLYLSLDCIFTLLLILC